MGSNNFDRTGTPFYNNPEMQEILIRNVVSKFWMKVDEKVDVDDMVHSIIGDLEFRDYLQYNDDDTDDFDLLREMVLHRIGYTGYYE